MHPYRAHYTVGPSIGPHWATKTELHCLPLRGTPPPARHLLACPPAILWQGILAGHLWSCSRCLFWMLSVLGVFCLPFPLPPALDHSARRILQTSFSTPYRTSTSLNLTPLNSTQLTSLFDLLGLHFGASWPPQIDPRSAQDRSKSHLEALFLQKCEFSKNIVKPPPNSKK